MNVVNTCAARPWNVPSSTEASTCTTQRATCLATQYTDWQLSKCHPLITFCYPFFDSLARSHSAFPCAISPRLWPLSRCRLAEPRLTCLFTTQGFPCSGNTYQYCWLLRFELSFCVTCLAAQSWPYRRICCIGTLYPPGIEGLQKSKAEHACHLRR